MELTYLTSSLEPSSWPTLQDPSGKPLQEVALAGRSNVGKSTLLNLLGGQKKLAKVSSTPGKTQRMQFFSVEERLLLADLPGYGFAKAPVNAQKEWSKAIDSYLKTRKTLRLLLLLLDARREPNQDDLAMISWANERGLALLCVLTKTDKLPSSELAMQKKKITSHLAPHFTSPIDLFCLPAPRRIIWNQIFKRLDAAQ